MNTKPDSGTPASDAAVSLLEAWDAVASVPTTDNAEAEPAAEPAPKKTRARKTTLAEAPVDAEAPAAEAEAPKRARKKATPATEEAAPRSLADLVTMAQAEPEPEVEAEAAPEAVAEDATGDTIETEDETDDGAITFAKLGLSDALLKSITSVGYEEPTPIQAMTIPELLSGRDVIAQAQTGSGKTAAFGLPIIEAINPRDRHVQALVLCPTRELAIQVAEALHKLGRHKEVETLPIYGGQPYERQFRGLQRGPQIVVGTPGRVMDHMRRETLNLDHIRFFILDEADEMLDMGFIDDIEWVMEQVPAERQTALFSATMPPRIAQLATRYMNEPERLTIPGSKMTVPEIRQTYYEVPRARKADALTRILDAETPSLSMIFCRTKLGVDELGETLMARGYEVETLHGDLSQAQRDRVMRRVRSGQADILIATDVAARGIDIPDVSHVFNYDIPESAEAYVHRIGRTGRAGKAGEAVTLITPRENRWLHQIERIVKAKIEPKRLPTVADVSERRREVVKQQILDVLQDEANYSFYTGLVDDIADDHDAAQIAAAVLKLYTDANSKVAPIEETPDDVAIVTAPAPRRERPERSFEPRERGPIPEGGNVRLFINIGRNLSVRPQDIVGAIANEAGVPGRAIGAIDIFDSYTFVDVPAAMTERIIDALIRSGIKGRSVNAEIARPDAGGGMRSERPRRDGYGDRGGFREDRGGFNRGGGFRDDRGGGFNRGGGYRGGGNFNREDRAPREGGFDRGPREGGFRSGPSYGGNDRFNDRPERGNDRFGDRPERGNDRFERGPRRDY
jgi:ATP-dependent RNA helicase DeaD